MIPHISNEQLKTFEYNDIYVVEEKLNGIPITIKVSKKINKSNNNLNNKSTDKSTTDITDDITDAVVDAIQTEKLNDTVEFNIEYIGELSPTITEFLDTNYKRNAEFIFEKLVSMNPTMAFLTIHGIIIDKYYNAAPMDFIAFDIQCPDENTIVCLDVKSRNNYLTSYGFKANPPLHVANLNSCIRYMKLNEVQKTTIPSYFYSKDSDALAEGMVLKPLKSYEIGKKTPLKSSNQKYLEGVNKENADKKALEYLRKTAKTYFNKNKLTKIIKENGKITKLNKDAYVSIICNNITKDLQLDQTFVVKFKKLSDDKKEEIKKEYIQMAKDLIANH